MAVDRPCPDDALAGVARVLADVVGVSLDHGLDLALRDAAAIAALVEHAVVAETSFWRHPEQLAAVGRLAAAAPEPLRIWSAGCATGEEPYSVAMALLEAGRLDRGDRVLATDVSARALEAARAGCYGPRAVRHLPPEVAARWLEPGVRRCVAPAARALVRFARHNLVADPAPDGGGFDLVLCRNVLIYFTPTTAAEVLYRLVGALRPGGTLALGPVELPLAGALALEWIEEGGATLLRRPR